MKEVNSIKKAFSTLFLVIPLFVWSLSSIAADSVSDELKTVVGEAIKTRQETQKSEDAWQIEKKKLETRLKALNAKNQTLTKTKEKLVKEVNYYETQNSQLLWEIQQSEVLTNHISPFLEVVYHRILRFIDNDTPFLAAERYDRLSRIRNLLDNPEATIGEKYRRTMEALLVELEYGNTIEVYQDRILVENYKINANIFRLGRVSLFFQTTDKKTTGRYDPAEQKWLILPRQHNRDVNTAFEIAAKRHPIEMLNLPLGKTYSP